MSKQTAVEWLGFELNLRLFFKVSEKEWDEINEICKQAKAMEREQIIEVWHNGYENQSPMMDEENCGANYYNETYKGGEQ